MPRKQNVTADVQTQSIMHHVKQSKLCVYKEYIVLYTFYQVIDCYHTYSCTCGKAVHFYLGPVFTIIYRIAGNFSEVEIFANFAIRPLIAKIKSCEILF